MVIEYANNQEYTQDILKPLALSFLMQIARQYTNRNQAAVPDNLPDRVVQFMKNHFDTITLKDIAKRFSYHLNYISTLLHREQGKSFSQILLEQLMDRTLILSGYSNSSNFYKAATAYMFPNSFFQAHWHYNCLQLTKQSYKLI